MISESKLLEIRLLASTDPIGAATKMAYELAEDIKRDNPEWGEVGDKAVAVLNDALVIVGIDEEKKGKAKIRKVTIEIIAGKPDTYDIDLRLTEEAARDA